MSDDLSHVTPEDVSIDDDEMPVTVEPIDEVAAYIKTHQPCTVPQIIRGLRMSRSTINHRINKLEGAGAIVYSMRVIKGHTKPSKFYTVKERVSA